MEKDLRRKLAWMIGVRAVVSTVLLGGAIVLVMQRLHEDDLAGVLLRGSDEWTVLNLPAIAQQDERIPIGNGRVRVRRAGNVLHPEREPREVLESLRAQLGPEIFSAQYQQQPVPPGGAMIKRVWVHRKGATRAFPPGHPEVPSM